MLTTTTRMASSPSSSSSSSSSSCPATASLSYSSSSKNSEEEGKKIYVQGRSLVYYYYNIIDHNYKNTPEAESNNNKKVGLTPAVTTLMNDTTTTTTGSSCNTRRRSNTSSSSSSLTLWKKTKKNTLTTKFSSTTTKKEVMMGRQHPQQHYKQESQSSRTKHPTTISSSMSSVDGPREPKIVAIQPCAFFIKEQDDSYFVETDDDASFDGVSSLSLSVVSKGDDNRTKSCCGSTSTNRRQRQNQKGRILCISIGLSILILVLSIATIWSSIQLAMYDHNLNKNNNYYTDSSSQVPSQPQSQSQPPEQPLSQPVPVPTMMSDEGQYRDSVPDEEQPLLPNNDFSFDQCVGETVPTCETIIKSQLNHQDSSIWKDVNIKFHIMELPSNHFGTEPQDIYIQVNSLGQVLSGGKTSKLLNDNPTSFYDSDNGATAGVVPNGFVGFDIILKVLEQPQMYHHGQSCIGLSFSHCCRNIQRSYQRLIQSSQVKNHDRYDYARIEEEISSEEVWKWDQHCFREVISPLATIYIPSPQSNISHETASSETTDVIITFDEFIYNDSTQRFELMQLLDPSKIVMTVPIQTNVAQEAAQAAGDGIHSSTFSGASASTSATVVSEVPRLMVRVVNTTVQEQQAESSFTRTHHEEEEGEDKDFMSPKIMMLHSISPPPPTTSTSTWSMVGHSLRVSLPTIIVFGTLCSCSCFFIFMCCIPVVQTEEEDESNEKDETYLNDESSLKNDNDDEEQRDHYNTEQDEYYDYDSEYYYNDDDDDDDDSNLYDYSPDTTMVHTSGNNNEFCRHSMVVDNTFYGGCQSL